MGPLHSFRAPPGARSLRRGPPARRRRPEEFPCHAPFFSRGRSKPPPTFPRTCTSRRATCSPAAASVYLLPAALVPFLGAALQVAWSHWLLGLEEGAVVETESRTLCPACGSPPMAGMIRQGGKETGLRYLSCSLCACEWHYVRIKCSHCEESKHLAYLSLEHDGQPAEKAVLRAETCPSCQGYLKQFYLEFDRHADALADDLASLALDMRLAEDGYLRRSPNLLLAPGGE